MQKMSWIVFNTLLKKCRPEAQGILLNYLDKKTKEQLSALPISYQDSSLGITAKQTLLQKIDASWLATYLRTLPESDIRLFLASLTLTQKEALKKDLLLSNHFPTLTSFAKEFLQAQLFEKLVDEKMELLAPECLPEYSLNILLDLSEKEFKQLIDLLGLYDMASELRQIIETSKLKQIYNALAPFERNFLKQLSQQKELIAFKRMGLDKWDGDIEHLKQLIHQRAINRLAKAVYGREASFLWYLSHRLSLADARMFQTLSSDLKNPQAVAALTRQIINLIQFIKEKKSLP
jgi:hypothetical protein